MKLKTEQFAGSTLRDGGSNGEVRVGHADSHLDAKKNRNGGLADRRSSIPGVPGRGKLADSGASCTSNCALEQLYSPEQVAEKWGLSVDKVRRMFENEPGVMVVEAPRVSGRRRYRTLRIPESVAQQVYHRLARKGNWRPTC